MAQETQPHVLDDIPAYLVGGLTPAERIAFEAHRSVCQTCDEALAEARSLDESLRKALMHAIPNSGFEDRLIAGFRQRTTSPQRLHPMVRRAATGAAAALLLGGFGYVVTRSMQDGGLPDLYAMVDGRLASRAASGLRQLGQAMQMYSNGELGVAAAAPARTPLSHAEAAEQSSTKRLEALWSKDHETAAPVPLSAAAHAEAGITFGTVGTPLRDEAGKAVSDRKLSLPLSSGATSSKDYRTAPITPLAPGQSGVDQALSLGSSKADDIVLNRQVGSERLEFKLSRGTVSQAQLGNDHGFRPTELQKELLSPPAERTPANRFAAQFPLAADAGQAKPPGVVFADVPANPPPTPTAAAAAAQSSAAPAQPAPDDSHKIIRQGEMTFEVDGFDSAVMNITKIVGEESGFVSTTDSDKLANGKVRGSVVLRVPPEHLDTLVLKLRGIGDLKSQKITAQDITRQYTDLQSELRAARAMEERLLDIIKTGKGAVKDLLEAEKQLGVWREKIEQVEGEIRYDNNQVALSTLTISLVERDIKTAAFASETEQVTMAIETDEVEKAYNGAKEAVAAAKGRIIQSDLKQFEAGQYAATLSAQLPPDAADAMVARLRQLGGRVANFQRQRSQSNQGGTAAPLDASRVRREDVTLSLTIYNLANIAPRRTTSLTLAADNVEEVYNAILDQAGAAGARIVASNLTRPRPDESTGSISIQVVSDKADALMASLRGSTELVRQETTENPDTQNVTSAKRGFVIEIISLAALAPRRSTRLTVAARDVDAAYRLVLDKLRAAGARVVNSGINRGTIEQTNATLNFQAPAEKSDALVSDLREAGETVHQETTDNPDTQNTTAARRGFTLTILSLAGVPARQSEQLQMAATSVPDAFNTILETLRGNDARIVASQLNQQDGANVTATIDYEIARPLQSTLESSIKDTQIISRNVTRSQDTENTIDSKLRCSLALSSAQQLPPRQTTTLGVEVADVQRAVDELTSAAAKAGGREVDKDISQEQNGRTVARVVVEVPTSDADALADQVEHWGNRRVKQSTRNPAVQDGPLSRSRLEVTFANAAASLGGEETTWDAIRHGLSVSGAGLRWSLQMIVVGLCFVAPWLLLVWGGWRLLRRQKSSAPSPVVP